METKQIGLRMPFDLVEWLEAQAKKERRNFTSQLNFIVHQAKQAQETNTQGQ